MVIDLSNENFEEEVFDAQVPVVVDFWAPWSEPCQLFDSIIENLAEEYGDKLKVGKLNIDENPAIAEIHSVMRVPTVMIFQGGEVEVQIEGAQSLESLRTEIDELNI